MRVDTPWRARAIGRVTRNEMVSGKPGTVQLRLASQLPGLARRQPKAPGRLDQHPVHLEWYAKVETSGAGVMSVLTDRFCKLLRGDSRAPQPPGATSANASMGSGVGATRSATALGARRTSIKASSTPIPDDIRTDVPDRKTREIAGGGAPPMRSFAWGVGPLGLPQVSLGSSSSRKQMGNSPGSMRAQPWIAVLCDVMRLR